MDGWLPMWWGGLGERWAACSGLLAGWAGVLCSPSGMMRWAWGLEWDRMCEYLRRWLRELLTELTKQSTESGSE